MTKYTTSSGSVYEVDEDKRRVRQVKDGGKRSKPSDHLKRKQWRVFSKVTTPGGRLCIEWPDGLFTVTSPLATTSEHGLTCPCETCNP